MISGRERPPQQGQPEGKTDLAVEAAAEAVNLVPGFWWMIPGPDHEAAGKH